MRRFLVFCIILAAILLPEMAYATCPANPLDCKDPSMRTSIPANNVKADGVTSDDAALKAVLDLCATVGGTVHLPPGRILLNGTGAAPITLQNCHIVGSGIIAGTNGVVASNGSMILLTSTSVKPFIAGNNWRMDGVSFYWPNQTTGTTAYPALLNCDVSCVSWVFEGNSVINAYDFFTDVAGAAIGGFKMVNNWLYAVHDLIRSAGQGDSFTVTGNQMTPGNWFRIAPSTAQAAANAGSLVNTIFHLSNNAGFGWNMIANNNPVFAWRYGFKLEATALMGISQVDMSWDGVGTVIDSTLGGTWATAAKMTGIGGGNAVDLATGLQRGNSPTFNLGANGLLNLNGWVAGVRGTFIKTAGTHVTLDNVTITNIGTAHDGADYYAVDYTANVNGTTIWVKNSLIQGGIADTHLFGIGSSNGTTATRVVIQNNSFRYLQTPINVNSTFTTNIEGNWSLGTTGTQSFIVGLEQSVSYGGNFWDKPPTAALSACGTSPSLQGGLDGFFATGTDAPTSCVLQLPFRPIGLCTFQLDRPGTHVGASVVNQIPTWTLTFSAPYFGFVYYHCNAGGN